MNVEKVRAFLQSSCVGRSNARTQDEIAAATGLPPLEVRKVIRQMRLNEALFVLSTPQRPHPGYYIPGDADSEISSKQITNLKFQAMHIMELIKPLANMHNKRFPTTQLKLDI